MKTFTYKDYIKCIHTLRLNAVLQLAEEGEKYKIQQNKIKNKHDRIIKKILNNEKEMSKFINDFLEPNKKVESYNLIKYTNSYITKKYKTIESDLVYKLKDKEIIFLLEHQSTIDNTIPYRLLNYCIDIMQEWIKTRKIGIESRQPIVVPIIIYTGDEKWKIPKNFKEKQIADYVFENYKIDLKYNLIEINKMSTKFLLEKRSMFGYGMIIEKSKDKIELKNNLDIILRNIKNKKQLEEIRNIILYLFNNSLEEEIIQELLDRIDIRIKEGDRLYEQFMRKTCK